MIFFIDAPLKVPLKSTEFTSLVVKDLAYEAKAKAKSFFSRSRPRT